VTATNCLFESLILPSCCVFEKDFCSTSIQGSERKLPSFGRRQPFFSKAQWASAIENADLEKLGDLIRVIGILLQTKVYLFWSKK
jgi:hypothetical protein